LKLLTWSSCTSSVACGRCAADSTASPSPCLSFRNLSRLCRLCPVAKSSPKVAHTSSSAHAGETVPPSTIYSKLHYNTNLHTTFQWWDSRSPRYFQVWCLRRKWAFCTIVCNYKTTGWLCICLLLGQQLWAWACSSKPFSCPCRLRTSNRVSFSSRRCSLCWPSCRSGNRRLVLPALFL